MRLIGFIVLAAIVLSTGFAALAAPAPAPGGTPVTVATGTY